jgi:methylthioribose-1-phosphate isomerase
VGGRSGHAALIDQRLLPGKVSMLRIRDAEAMRRAIRTLAVRGAPAIGVAGAYGFYLGARKLRSRDREAFLRGARAVAERLSAARPTAVNLAWAVGRVMRACESAARKGAFSTERALGIALDEARAIHDEDAALCDAIGRHGATLLRSGWTVLTHCNAGALATGGMGTALAVVYAAARAGKDVKVIADETRPLLQGARLTCWELERSGIDVTLICDVAAAGVLRAGRAQCVVVGADRIAANGDVANKVGTYGLAVLAREHGVPFYVAAPATTFDLSIPDGEHIPIEERSAEEVTQAFGRRTAPRAVRAYNPAFDVTPAGYVSAFVTDRGIIRPPFRRGIRRAFRAHRP